MHFGPVNCNFGDGAWNLLPLVGIMLSAGGFFAEVLGSRLNRRLREASIEMDERNRRFDESVRARALPLNAYALPPLGCMTASDATAMIASQTAKVIAVSARLDQFRRPAIAYPRGSV
jgi:hypothetical protein